MGGGKSVFGKKGKCWTIGGLKNHLRLVAEYNRTTFSCYSDCELVTYEEVICKAGIDLADLLNPIEQDIIADRLRGI